MKIISIIALLLISLVFSSCQEDILNEIGDSGIIIKMSVPNTDDLKSNNIGTSIAKNDTVTIKDLRDINIIFSAEDELGNELVGTWHINLIDCDNDSEVHQLYNRPNFNVFDSNLASIKPTELGLYHVYFSHHSKQFGFYVKHIGIPGTIGDDSDNHYAFRMEKKNLQERKSGEIMTAYTLYLQADFDQFAHWDNNPEGPNNEDNWLALLLCGGDNQLQIGNFSYNAKQFKLKKSKYSSSDYLYFTFYPEDTPPIESLSDNKMYRVHFYAGEFGQSWWGFSSSYWTSWRDNITGAITFMVF